MPPELQAWFDYYRQALNYAASIPGLNASTADSIFSVVGWPNRPLEGTVDEGGYTSFYKPAIDQVQLGDSVWVEDLPPILAHEMTHQQQFSNRSKDLSPILDVLDQRFEDSSLDQARQIFDSYYGPGYFDINAGRRFDQERAAAQTDMHSPAMDTTRQAIRQSFKDDLISDRGLEWARREMNADTMMRGYRLARQMHQFPGETTQRLIEAEEQYPGTLDAFRYWIKGFSEIPTPPPEVIEGYPGQPVGQQWDWEYIPITPPRTHTVYAIPKTRPINP